MANPNDPITIFFDSQDQIVGACSAGQEQSWLEGIKGENPRDVVRQMRSTEGGWQEWARLRVTRACHQLTII